MYRKSVLQTYGVVSPSSLKTRLFYPARFGLHSMYSTSTTMRKFTAPFGGSTCFRILLRKKTKKAGTKTSSRIYQILSGKMAKWYPSPADQR